MRKKAHITNVKRAAKGSRVANHAWSHNHVIDFNNASIIDKRNVRIRKCLESWHTYTTPDLNNNSCPLPGQYRILFFLALRVKEVQPEIINNTQTGYVEGRFIGENIRFISDILNFTIDQDIEGIALFIDFEKAFDSVEWEYLFKVLDTFQFGSDFKT